MSGHSLSLIDASFTVVGLAEPLAVSPAIDVRVNEIWSAAIGRQASMFDGTVLCVQELSNRRMNCCSVPYRYIYAQSRDPEIRAALHVNAAAVSGVMVANEHVLIAERSMQVTQSAGKFELVPSGGLPADRGAIDFRRQLLNEMTEEVNVSPEYVTSIEPFALITDEEEAVVDICCRIVLGGIDESTIIAAFKQGEYSRLQAVLPAELIQMVEVTPQKWVPTSQMIVRHLFCNLGG